MELELPERVGLLRANLGCHLLQLLKDEDLIARARGEATDLVSADPDLARHPALRDAITELLGVQAEYLDKT